MRLFLAVAVLMLALVAYTEAQDTETFAQKFAQFREQVAQVGKNLADGARDAYEKVQNSDFAANTRAAFADFVEKVKARTTDTIN